MNRKELKDTLQSNGFIANSYSLEGGLADNTHCLDDRGYEWAVYYTERGEVTAMRSFSSETEACDFFLQRMHSDPTTKPREQHDYIPKP